MTLTHPLKPYSASETSQKIQLTSKLKRHEDRLSFCFELEGDNSSVIMPGLSPTPGRKDRLWETTCLEAFLGPLQGEEYWEINVSPSGDWNIYRFDHYRQGMRPESGATLQDWARSRTPSGGWMISFSVHLPAILNIPVTIGISAVLDGLRENSRYWALAHTNTQPDFHHSKSRILIL
jgi:hypothetical protein